MSLENITSKIIKDAQEAGDLLVSEAKSQAETMTREAEEKASQIVKISQEKGEADRDKLIDRRRSVAVLDGKKVFLEKKQELIAECFEDAINEILAMKQDEYVDLLAGKVKATGITSGELVFNSEEVNTIGPLVIKKLKELVPDNKFELSQETKSIRGGFLLKQSQSYINGSVEAMVEEVKDELTGKLATVLFK